jgi:DNA-binding NarL/FixJ family response regulator
MRCENKPLLQDDPRFFQDITSTAVEVGLSEHRDSSVIQTAFDIGACGYVLKSDSNSDLIPGIRAVLVGERFVSRSLKNWQERPYCID